MNPSGNRKAEPPMPPDQPQQLPVVAKEPAAIAQTPAAIAQTSAAIAQTSAVSRKTPIAEPSHPQQYRAIGLVRGIYEPSAEQITRGTLATADGSRLDSVLLGRLLSLIKNHLDLSQEHLWVVYPRTRQTNDHLHLQVVGVWEPETLDKDNEALAENVEEVAQDGFFSIRGEVVFAAHEKEVVVVKIRQSPKKETDKTKFFKVKLKGTLSDRPVGHFWDLKVQLDGYDLVIQSSEDMGFIKKKPFLRTDKKRPFQKRDSRSPSDLRPRTTARPITDKKPISKPIINKPIKNPPSSSDSV